MISGIDIQAFQDWDAEEPSAVNAIGWEVQKFIGYWASYTHVLEKRSEAAAWCDLLRLEYSKEQFRVYEALAEREVVL